MHSDLAVAFRPREASTSAMLVKPACWKSTAEMYGHPGTPQGALPSTKGQEGRSLSWQQNSTLLRAEHSNSFLGSTDPSQSRECGAFPSAKFTELGDPESMT